MMDILKKTMVWGIPDSLKGSSSTERAAAADMGVATGEASLPACVAVEAASGGGAALSFAEPT